MYRYYRRKLKRLGCCFPIVLIIKRLSNMNRYLFCLKAQCSEGSTRSLTIINSSSSRTLQVLSAWDYIFPASMMTVAAVDRLIHRITIIELEG